MSIVLSMLANVGFSSRACVAKRAAWRHSWGWGGAWWSNGISLCCRDSDIFSWSSLEWCVNQHESTMNQLSEKFSIKLKTLKWSAPAMSCLPPVDHTSRNQGPGLWEQRAFGGTGHMPCFDHGRTMENTSEWWPSCFFSYIDIWYNWWLLTIDVELKPFEIYTMKLWYQEEFDSSWVGLNIGTRYP